MKKPYNPAFGALPEQYLGRDDIVDSLLMQ